MENPQSPGNDGLTVEFYKFYKLFDLKDFFMSPFLKEKQ